MSRTGHTRTPTRWGTRRSPTMLRRVVLTLVLALVFGGVGGALLYDGLFAAVCFTIVMGVMLAVVPALGPPEARHAPAGQWRQGAQHP